MEVESGSQVGVLTIFAVVSFEVNNGVKFVTAVEGDNASGFEEEGCKV